jgi:predicted PurR-regulated permease PerM
MNTPREPDIGETTATLPEPKASAQAGFYARLGVALLSALLLYVVVRIVTPLWQPLLWAVLIGSLLAPLNARLAVRLGGRPQLASGITTIGVFLLLLLPLLGMVAAVATQAGQLLGRINTSSLRASSSLDLSTYPLLARPLQWLDDTAGVKLEQIEAWIVAAAKRLLEVVAASGGSVVLGAVGTLVSVVLTLFVLFFVLRDGPRFANSLVRMLPIEPQLRGKLWRHLIDVTRAVFMGIGLTAVAQGVLLGVGFAIAGLPSPLVFGVLAVLFALVPFVGPAILWIPAALWLLSQGQPHWAIFRPGRSPYPCRFHRRHGRAVGLRVRRTVPGADRPGPAGGAVPLRGGDARAGIRGSLGRSAARGVESCRIRPYASRPGAASWPCGRPSMCSPCCARHIRTCPWTSCR